MAFLQCIKIIVQQNKDVQEMVFKAYGFHNLSFFTFSLVLCTRLALLHNRYSFWILLIHTGIQFCCFEKIAI